MLRDIVDRSRQVVALLRGKIGDMMAFDLTKLTLAGWTGFVTSVAMAILTCFFFASLGWFAGDERPAPLAGILVWAVAIGWFLGCRWLFSQFGIPFYRAVENPDDNS